MTQGKVVSSCAYYNITIVCRMLDIVLKIFGTVTLILDTKISKDR